MSGKIDRQASVFGYLGHSVSLFQLEVLLKGDILIAGPTVRNPALLLSLRSYRGLRRLFTQNIKDGSSPLHPVAGEIPSEVALGILCNFAWINLYH